MIVKLQFELQSSLNSKNMVCEIVPVEMRQSGNQIDNAGWNAMRVKLKFTKDNEFTGNKDDQRLLDNICIDNFVYTMNLSSITLLQMLLMKIRDNYANRNAILSIHQLLENSDKASESSYNTSHNTLKQLPKYAQLNCDITASLRFSGKLNDLVVFGRLRFFAIQVLLFAPVNGKHIKVTVQEITDQIWLSRNFLANVKPEHGKYLSTSRYRGNLVTQKMSDSFVAWTPK